MSLPRLDRSRASLHLLRVGEPSSPQEPSGRGPSDATDAQRLEDGRGLRAHETVTGRSGKTGLPAEIFDGEDAASRHQLPG